MMRVPGLVVLLFGLTCCLFARVGVYMLVPIGLLLLLWTGWPLLIGLTLAPVIVREREQRTWDVLRITPPGTEAILISKVRGALWPLRRTLREIAGLLVFWSVGVGLYVMLMAAVNLMEWDTITESPYTPERLSWGQLCFIVLAGPVASGLVYIIDRAQQLMLMITAALAASVSAASVRAALVGVSAAMFFMWLADMGVAVILLVAQPGAGDMHMLTRVVMLSVFGPVPGYLTELSPGRAALYLAGTLIIREIIIRCLWRWTVRAAERPTLPYLR
jgi:hypothetical protein